MTPVKSAPTSGPLTVSSHEIHEPQGMSPPAQLFIVPLRLVNESSTSPKGVTSTVVVPPSPCASYGVPGPNAFCGFEAGRGLFTSWFRTNHTLPSGPGNAAMPS